MGVYTIDKVYFYFFLFLSFLQKNSRGSTSYAFSLIVTKIALIKKWYQGQEQTSKQVVGLPVLFSYLD